MALTKKLEAIGDSIRSKTGTTKKMTLDEMKDAIDGIGSVPAPPDEAFIITGNCKYKFAYGGWDWFINLYGDKITTKEIEDASNMFDGSKVTEIPFDININSDPYSTDCCYLFQYVKFTKAPYVKGRPYSLDSVFSCCSHLTEIPEDWVDYIDWGTIHYHSSSGVSDFFNSCASLRRIPNSLLSNLHNPYATWYWYKFYYHGINCCYVLDEIKGIPVDKAELSSSAFTSFCDSTSRLKGITFATNEDGTAQTAKWKSQTISLIYYIGYSYASSYITDYSAYHGITTATRVTDDASYQALKDNPDWWTTDVAYSRYNHDSAVETINSLPDTSEYLAANGGTNTIKFKGAAGSKTDGGAINTLTEEEIAVAAAKGWTVTLV